MAILKAYTKEVIPGTYQEPLAHSVHFALSVGGDFQPLHHDYGILFPKADVDETNTIKERGVINPLIGFDGTEYYVFADKIDREGNFLDTVICWTTTDFISFSEEVYIGVPAISELMESAQDESGFYTVNGIESASEIELPDDLVPAIWRTYGEYNGAKSEVKFPLAVGYADPQIFKWEDRWYFLATNDNTGDIGLFLRRADTIENLFRPVTWGHTHRIESGEKTFEEACILPYDEARSLCQTFWAPEFHVIGGEAYILFAVSGQKWGPQCHVMHLKKGGDPLNAEDWDNPLSVRRSDGWFLATDGITLDMTYIKSGEKSYVAWSYRYGIGSPMDTGSMIFIATIDEKRPWIITSDPVLLTRPLYGFENVNGTINNEGPFALYHDGKIYLSYSGGDACGYYYAVSFLVADEGSDLLDPGSWQKMHTSVFNSSTVKGIIGPGHNSFFTGEDGETYIAYHAQERGEYDKRCSTYHKVVFTEEGFPRFDGAEYKD